MASIRVKWGFMYLQPGDGRLCVCGVLVCEGRVGANKVFFSPSSRVLKFTWGSHTFNWYVYVLYVDCFIILVLSRMTYGMLTPCFVIILPCAKEKCVNLIAKNENFYALAHEIRSNTKVLHKSMVLLLPLYCIVVWHCISLRVLFPFAKSTACAVIK